jgi:hypothetical protein
MDGLGAKLLHSLVKLFFLAGFNFSLNKDLDGHDRSSVISERDFKISMLWLVKKSTSSFTGTLDFSDFERLCKSNIRLYFNSSLHPYKQE